MYLMELTELQYSTLHCALNVLESSGETKQSTCCRLQHSYFWLSTLSFSVILYRAATIHEGYRHCLWLSQPTKHADNVWSICYRHMVHESYSSSLLRTTLDLFRDQEFLRKWWRQYHSVLFSQPSTEEYAHEAVLFSATPQSTSNSALLRRHDTSQKSTCALSFCLNTRAVISGRSLDDWPGSNSCVISIHFGLQVKVMDKSGRPYWCTYRSSHLARIRACALGFQHISLAK